MSLMETIDTIIEKVFEDGKGRTVVLLTEQRSAYAELRTRVERAAIANQRVISFQLPLINDQNWNEITEALQNSFDREGLRQISLIGFGDAAVVAQSTTLKNLRGNRSVSIRSLMVIDGVCHAHATWWLKVIGRIEKSLPLGLPFRNNERGFDSKPFLQRIRCPVLVATTWRATSYEREQAELMCKRLPTAWRLELSEERETDQIVEEFLVFREVPVKCPQKKVG